MQHTCLRLRVSQGYDYDSFLVDCDLLEQREIVRQW
jgi:hypothetical protein